MKTKTDVLRIARNEVGTKEYPAGSNTVKYNTWYYGRKVSGPSYPWCMAFVEWVFHEAGFSLFKTASCSALAAKYKAAGKWVTWGFKPGDIIMFDFSGKKTKTQHVGICVDTDPVACTVTTIEGNTSVTSNDNGGAVMIRVRKVGLISGACRPNYNL